MANTVAPNVERIKRMMAQKQQTLDRNAQKRKNIHPRNLFVGWTDKSGAYAEQKGKPKVKEVARIHEFGLGDQTESAMIRKTKNQYKKQWMKFYKKMVLPALIKGDKSKVWVELRKLGGIIKMDLAQTVWDIDLVDTSRLARSVVVEFKGR